MTKKNFNELPKYAFYVDYKASADTYNKDTEDFVYELNAGHAIARISELINNNDSIYCVTLFEKDEYCTDLVLYRPVITLRNEYKYSDTENDPNLIYDFKNKFFFHDTNDSMADYNYR